MIDSSILQGKKAAYFTLGCKLNFAETSTVAQELQRYGVTKAVKGEVADICIVNTCSVTEVADHKCRQAIHKLVKQNPGAFVVVTGCYAQLKPQDIIETPGVDMVVGAEEKASIIQHVMEGMTAKNEESSLNEELRMKNEESQGNEELRIKNEESAGNEDSVCNEESQGKNNSSLFTLHSSLKGNSSLKNSSPKENSSLLTTPLKDIRSFAPSCSRGDRTRYFLKVQDGCNYYCTYCTIPIARGRSRNGSIESLVKQAEQAAAEGGKEIVITGVNIGDFGHTTGETFFDLVKALDKVEGIERYRISSIEPNLLTDEIIEYCATSKKFMPHFHIPLQSGSDDVLRLMHRKYDTALFRHKIELIKSLMPHCFIGVDVIVGTRGETPEFFEDAYNFIKSLPITQLHVFSYSERPGTKALEIPYVVSPQTKHERSQRLLALSEEKLHEFYASQIGQVRPVLFEHAPKSKPMHGFTDNYIKVEIPNNPELDNKIMTVMLGDFNKENDALCAKML